MAWRWILPALFIAGCTESGEPASGEPPKAKPETTAAAPDMPVAAKPKEAFPRRRAKRTELEDTTRNLKLLVKKGVTENANPWAMAHGIVGFGPELKAADGRLAIDALIRDYLREEKLGSRTRWYFPPRTSKGLPLEPHANLVVKTLVVAGVPLDRSFETRSGQRVTLGELLDSAEADFQEPASAHGWADQAWTVEAILAARALDADLELKSWQTTPGRLGAKATEALVRLQAFLDDAMEKGRPDLVEKRKQDIYAHTCGGLHFVQTVARAGSLMPDLADKARAQLERVRFRFSAERSIYQTLLRDHPEYRRRLLVQEMKFYGHVLETFGLAAEWGLIQPDDELRTEMQEVAGDLVDTVRELEESYGQQDAIRQKAPQVYYDLIGDGCHAIRGLRLGLKHFYEAEA
ncbi:MAG: hypothetical protein AAF627_00010 [Myxococcota bacterium]